MSASQSEGLQIGNFSVGQKATFTKTVTEADIVLYAGISGDTNPVHLDAEYAQTTMFKQRIAHGMLSAGFISAVLGNKLPGPGAIYLKQDLRFKAPVMIGDTVTAIVEITAIEVEKNRLTLATQCHVGEKVVIDGEAQILIPKS